MAGALRPHDPVGFAAAASEGAGEGAGKWTKARGGLDENFVIAMIPRNDHDCRGQNVAVVETARARRAARSAADPPSRARCGWLPREVRAVTALGRVATDAPHAGWLGKQVYALCQRRIVGALRLAARSALAPLWLIAPATAADGEPGACPAAGTVIVTSLDTTLRFAPGQGLVCSVTPSGAASYQTFGLVTLVNSMNYQANKAAIAGLWPLAVGKVVKFTARRGSYQWIASYTVSDQRSITVPAGTFPVFVVVYEETQTSPNIVASHSGIYHSIWTYYISTDVGYYVKMDYPSISGGPSAYYQHTPWEAVSITRPP